MDHSRIESSVRSKKRSHGFCGNIAATREGDVGMKRAKIRLETRRDGSFLDALVQLEEVRMPSPDPDPNDFWPALPRKGPEASQRKEKRFP